MKTHRTREDFSAKEIVIAYTKLFTNSSLIKQLVQISIVSLEIQPLANTIKTHCCGKDQFSNLCLNLNDSLYRITEDELNLSEEQVVRKFNWQIFSAKDKLEIQEILQQIWDKLEFPVNSGDVLSLSYSIKLPGCFISEVISREEEGFLIKPQDNHNVAYAASYVRQLFKNLHKITDVTVKWNDNGVNRVEKVQPYWNQKTGKVQLMRCIC